MSEGHHICVVDDDHEIRALLSDYLTRNGLRVRAFADGAGLRRFLAHGATDLIILDVMLPAEDGFAICRELRATTDTPIMLVTARGEEVDRIVGLELGADDYIIKPFSPRELLARIRNLLRRTDARLQGERGGGVSEYRFAGWALVADERCLRAPDGQRVALSGGEYLLLHILLSHADSVLSRNQIASLLRGREVDPFDRSIDVQVSRLRQILGDDGRRPKIIKTVYGQGYVVGGVVACPGRAV